MPSTHKKVIVCKLDRSTIPGYVNPAAFLADGKVELLNTSGQVVTVELSNVKGVYFVRDFDDSGALPSRRTFATRPRTEGLWVRLRFRDNEVLEGMMPNDLTQPGEGGFLVTPPDTRSNTQRIFVPRGALTDVTVLAVIGGPQSRRRTVQVPDTRQVRMFTE